MEHWQHIDFVDDNDGCLFKTIVHRKIPEPRLLVTLSPEKEVLSPEVSPRVSSDIKAVIMGMIRRDNAVTAEIIAKSLNISKRTVLRRLEELKKQGSIHRIGARKGGKWKVV